MPRQPRHHAAVTVVPARRRISFVPVAAAVLALLVVVAVALQAGPLRASGKAQSPTTALLLSGSSLSYADGQLAAQDLRWQAGVYALPGAGISRSNLDPTGSITRAVRRLLPAPDRAPDVVVIQGGEADHASSPEMLQRACEHLIDYVRAHAGPQAQLVLVGPIPGAAVPPSLTAVNDLLKQVAADREVPYVDAVALGWRAGSPEVPGALAEQLAAALSVR